MDIKKIVKDKMKYEYIYQISKWKYDGEYKIYNLPSINEMKEKRYNILKEEMANNYICYLINRELIAYTNIKKMNNKKIFLGIGLKPNYCGQGYGSYFIKDSIKEITKKYPSYKIYLEVRSWNKRAINAYLKEGFKISETKIKKDRYGNNNEFIIMNYIEKKD